MSGRMSKSRVPLKPQSSLPLDAAVALITAKNQIKSNAPLAQFGNNRGNPSLRGGPDGPPLPDPSNGCDYFEWDIGAARDGDPEGKRGVRRFVFEINLSSRQVLEVYYTEEHYRKFSFFRIV